MASSQDKLLEKFSGLKAPEGSMRRVDFKGDRRRLNLRVEPTLRVDLTLIKALTGEDKNAFCVRVLEAGIKEAVEALKGKYEPAVWDAVQKHATRRK